MKTKLVLSAAIAALVLAACAKQEAAAPAAPAGPTELDVLLQIRDSLKK